MATSVLSRQSRIDTVIEAAYRRFLWVLIAKQLPVVLSLMLSGMALILLFGTQLLNPAWMIVLIVGGAAFVAAQVRRQMLDRYRLAQLLDQHLRSADSLSTAWFVLHNNQKSALLAGPYQLAGAEQVAGSVNPSAAFPIQAQRMWILPLLFGALVIGLFTGRYITTKSLDLRPSVLPPLSFAWLEGSHSEMKKQDQQASRGQPPKPVPSPGLNDHPGSPRDGRDQSSDAPQTASSHASPNSNAPEQISKNSRGDEGDHTASPGDLRSSKGDDGSSPASEKTDSPREGASKPSDRSARMEQSRNQDGQTGSSVMSRMKDALSSLLSKVQSNGSTPGSRQEGTKQSNNGKRSAAGNEDKDGAGQPSSEQNKGTTAGAQSGEPTQGGEKSQSSPTGSSDQLGANKSQDQQSGAGSQDGEKSLHDAEQLKAIGKLEEILGKRSAQMTGDVTIETPSSSQELRTEYSSKTAHHSDLGGELHRDQVPREYQEYVKEYMELVHRQPSAKP